MTPQFARTCAFTVAFSAVSASVALWNIGNQLQQLRERAKAECRAPAVAPMKGPTT